MDAAAVRAVYGEGRHIVVRSEATWDLAALVEG